MDGIAAKVMALAVHEHVPRGIPYFVTKVPVAFHAPDVELDVSACRRKRVKSEAQRISTVAYNTVGKVLASCFFDFSSHLRLHHATGPFRD